MTTIAILTTHAQSLIGFRSNLIKKLHEEGVKVYALAPNYNSNIKSTIESLGGIPVDCSFSRSGLNPLVDLVNIFHLSRLYRNIKPDIALCYFIKPVIFGTIAASIARVPLRVAMIEGMGYVFTKSDKSSSMPRKFLKLLVLFLYKISLSFAHKVIFLNNDDRDELVSSNVLSVDKTFILGAIGVDLKRWTHSEPSTYPVTFLMVARLLREKGVEQYYRAASLVKKIHPEVNFILLGGLDENPGAIDIATVKRWEKYGVIEWHDHADPLEWYKACSVFVLPSYREGFPVSTQEAMAVGRAVITSDVPGCRETVVDGCNGFLIPAHDHIALSEKMIHLIENPDLIIQMGKKSNQIATKEFDQVKKNFILYKFLMT